MSGGVVFTPEAGERVARAVRWVEGQRGRPGAPAGRLATAETVWARVTSGTADGDGYYPGVVTLYAAADEAWSDYSTVKVAPLNGETLSSGTRYAVRPSGRTAGGDELYTVVGGPGAGTIAVEAADGTPAYAGVTKVTFDQADGVVLSQPSAGVVRIDVSAASYFGTGVVTNAAQTFGGLKTFQDQVKVYNSVSDVNSPIHIGDNLGTATLAGGYGITMYGASTGLYVNSSAQMTIRVRHNAYGDIGVFAVSGFGQGTLVGYDEYGEILGTGSLLVYGRYDTWNGTSVVTGASGTLEDGTSVLNGLVTGIGAGGSGWSGTVP